MGMQKVVGHFASIRDNNSNTMDHKNNAEWKKKRVKVKTLACCHKIHYLFDKGFIQIQTYG